MGLGNSKGFPLTPTYITKPGVKVADRVLTDGSYPMITPDYFIPAGAANEKAVELRINVPGLRNGDTSVYLTYPFLLESFLPGVTKYMVVFRMLIDGKQDQGELTGASEAYKLNMLRRSQATAKFDEMLKKLLNVNDNKLESLFRILKEADNFYNINRTAYNGGINTDAISGILAKYNTEKANISLINNPFSGVLGGKARRKSKTRSKSRRRSRSRSKRRSKSKTKK